MALALHPNDARVHVFELRPGPMRLARRTYLSGGAEAEGDTPLREAFGAPVDPDHVEVFALEDIAPLSLRDYLGQAHDIPGEALAADRARLDAVRGQVVIMTPRALAEVNELDPDAQLVHVGSYAPPSADDAPRGLPRTERRPAGGRAGNTARPGLSRATILWVVVAALALAALALLAF